VAPEYLEDSQDSYLGVQVAHLEDLLVDHLVHLAFGDTLLMSTAGTDLAPGVHRWNCWANRIQDILVILGAQMDNLRSVDNPVLDVEVHLEVHLGDRLDVHLGILSILGVTDIYILPGLEVVGALEAVDCLAGGQPRHLGAEAAHCNHDQVHRGLPEVQMGEVQVDLEDLARAMNPVAQTTTGVPLMDSDQAAQLEGRGQVAVINSVDFDSNPLSMPNT